MTMTSGVSIVAETIDPETIRTLYEVERLGFREVALRLGVTPWQVYRVMRQHGIVRRHGTEQNYATYKTKPQFVLNINLSPTEEQLRIAGTMLYLAEGAKTGKTVDSANSDPELIKIFVAYLRRICGVAESRLRVLLYAYADQDVEQLKAFWSRVTHIPPGQFIKPYVRPLTPNRTGRKMVFGLVHIRYNDSRLLRQILAWGKELPRVWAGT